jgi:RNA polymerase sigma-70 factor (ECF subfamily)
MIGDRFDAVLAAARTGDELAWSVLYDDLSGTLLGYLRARGAPDPEDQLGETFLQLARDLATFDGDERGFRSWVFTIAHRRLLDASRWRRRRPATPVRSEQLTVIAEALADDASMTDELLASIVDRDLLAQLLRPLNDEQREVLVLRFIVDLSPAEVAAITGRSPNAVAAITHRALGRIRTLIGPAEH